MADLNFSLGDEVRLRLSKGEVDGVFLDSSDKSVYLIKLKSGYNIGIPKENVLAGRVLKKYNVEDKSEKVGVKLDKKKPTIALVVTGGTIASKLDPRTGGVGPLTNVEEFRKYYPDLFERYNVLDIEIPFMRFSEDMASQDWKEIARSCEKLLNRDDVEGVIVTHGTDTLHYTASALSFFLRDLGKPVVLTYAQRSIDRASSDAKLNLLCAAKVATSGLAEVVVVGHGSIDDDFCLVIRGTRARKMHSSRRDAFKSINCSPIAKVWPDKMEFLDSYNARDKKRKLILDDSFSDKVALVKFYPGQSPDVLDFYALKYKGLVIEGTGLGHVASSGSEDSWISKLKKHIRNGLVVCMTTQCLNGRVDEYVYSSGREIMDSGVIYLGDMISETAFVKLGWVLGHNGWKKYTKEKMLENFSGEIGKSLNS